MAVDPAFTSVPKTTPCFLVWRIEDFSPKAIPKDQYGKFYEGDSYLILVQKDTKGALDVKIHFWLGKDTTQDEAGTAAIKAVELDDYLGGGPVQYREVQNSESKVFLSYFKQKGIMYLSGGVASGFNHVENKVKPRLMQVKGKSCPRVMEIPIAWSNMNDGDAFILDIGEVFFVWMGKTSSRTEKRKAMEVARQLRDDRGKGNLVALEDGEETASNMGADEYELFDTYLPVAEKDQLKPATAAGCDDTYERKAGSALKLWKVSDASGQLEVTEVAGKPLKKEMLDTFDCFIVDNAEAGIWVWCGKKANKEEKKQAMTNALNFLKKANLPDHVNVTKVYEMGEPTEFKTLFKVWEKPILPGQAKVYSQSKIARTVQTKFDASTMHDNPQVAKETGMVDDGSGTKTIYRIEREGNSYEMKELDKKYHGQLYGGDSYVIQYTYKVGGREHYIVYFWLGRKSTQDEKGVAARKTVELDDALNGAAKQVRVVHGKEPNHFLSMFGGTLIIFDGGKAGWGEKGDEGPGDTFLLHVRGTSAINTKAEQVPCIAESLNSNDVFVLFSKSAVFIWAGKGCTGDEREMAKRVAEISPRGYNLIVEGQEKEEFWTLLGGKGEYSTSPRLAEPSGEHEPRLFQCSNASGRFTVNEVSDFSQVDLVTDDVFILDAFDQVFVWVGDDARPEEKTMAMDAAIEYIETDPSGRDEGTPIFLVKQGLEPPDFVGYFGVWDRDLWSGGKSYEDLKREYGDSNIDLEQIKNKSASGDAPFSGTAKFSLEQLTLKDGLPSGVDKQHKEKHLSDEDFQALFNMSYAEFVSLPQWKQTRLKKEKDLF